MKGVAIMDGPRIHIHLEAILITKIMEKEVGTMETMKMNMEIMMALVTMDMEVITMTTALGIINSEVTMDMGVVSLNMDKVIMDMEVVAMDTEMVTMDTAMATMDMEVITMDTEVVTMEIMKTVMKKIIIIIGMEWNFNKFFIETLNLNLFLYVKDHPLFLDLFRNLSLNSTRVSFHFFFVIYLSVKNSRG